MKIGIMIGVLDAEGAEPAIAKAGRIGIRGIESLDRDVAPYYDDPRAFRALFDKAGVELSGIYFLWGDDLKPEREGEVLLKAQTALAFLQEVDCRFLVMNAGVFNFANREFSDAEFQTLAKWSNRIGAEARKRDVQAVIHPHVHAMIETNGDLERLLAAGLDRDLVGLCVHAGHQLMKGVDPYEMYEKYAAWVRYAHISDHSTQAGAGAFMGEGILDQQRLMKPLLDNGYDGWIVIESRKEGVDATEYAPKAVSYLKSQWPNVAWE